MTNRQQVFPFPKPPRRRRRRRVGRPRIGRGIVPHRRRARFKGRNPLHVTVRVRRDIPRLRRMRMMRVLAAAFVHGCDKDGTFRICQFSIQGNHIHLVCEATNHEALARGMQGFKVRVARGINRHLGRSGTVWAERYHVEVLDNPSRVRAALSYVLLNARRHGAQLAKGWADSFSSARYFDGWRSLPRMAPCEPGAKAPVAKPRTWLLREGWKKRGLIDPDEVPGPARRGVAAITM